MQYLRRKYSNFIGDVSPPHSHPYIAVPRSVITSYLGGGGQATTVVARKDTPFQGRSLAYPECQWNCVPLAIGDGGLIFALRYNLNAGSAVHSVFVKDDPAQSPPLWAYRGEYSFDIVGKLTALEASRFPETVSRCLLFMCLALTAVGRFRTTGSKVCSRMAPRRQPTLVPELDCIFTKLGLNQMTRTLLMRSRESRIEKVVPSRETKSGRLLLRE